MKKYEACFGNVRAIEVERETDKSVWVNGRRHDKGSTWRPLFDTEAEAWLHIINLARNRVTTAKNAVERAEQELANAIKRAPDYVVHSGSSS